MHGRRTTPSGAAGPWNEILGRGRVLKLEISALLLFTACVSHAQSIQQSPDAVIATMTAAQVDAHMQAVAETISKSSPIRSDETTSITGAAYLKPMRTLVYRVSLSTSVSAQDAAKAMKPGFCSGRTNLALMAKGVVYQYGVTTPSESYNLIFSRRDCP